MLITLKYRIKDSTSRKKLEAMKRSVNYTWNYCNEVSNKSLVYNQKWLSGYDLNKLTAGCSKDLNISADTIQLVGHEYALKRKSSKKKILNWRTTKSLGWVPFRKSSIKVLGKGKISYFGNVFSFWQSKEIGEIKVGSFNQDSQQRWYLNLVCEIKESCYVQTGLSIGIDLGIKSIATYSNGEFFNNPELTKKYKKLLANAQRANKKKRISKIHLKIKNSRKDLFQKETTRLVKTYDKIVIGDLSLTKLNKTSLHKEILDVSWTMYKSLLEYKTIRFGREMVTVNESWTSRTCNICKQIADFKGLKGLSIREWICGYCNTTHNRDVNAAINILRLGYQTLEKGVPLKKERYQICN